MDEYISKQDMLNAVEKLDIIPSVDGMGNPTNAEDFRVQFLGTVLKVEPADVAPVEILKAEIYKLKCQQNSKNQDYYTGYMSALSTVEGILSRWMERSEWNPTEPQEIGYDQCANAMLKMWMDNVVSDAEYNRIIDRLNKLYFSGGERKE